MTYLDDSLVPGFPNRFTNMDAYLNFAIDKIVEHLIDDLGYPETEVLDVEEEFWESDPDDWDFTEAEWENFVADMLTEDIISNNEATYLKRWKSFQTDCGTDLDELEDSLDDWKADILAISWGPSEVNIKPFMSIATYSFDHWRYEAFDDTDPDYPVDSLLNRMPDIDEVDAAALQKYLDDHSDEWSGAELWRRACAHAAMASALGSTYGVVYYNKVLW
jgi:hypothetical protein